MMTEFCPVPAEQQPINEYAQLQTSWFFRGAIAEGKDYGRLVAILGGIGCLLASPIAWASFPLPRSPWGFTIATIAGGLVAILLVTVQWWVGWHHIRQRLEARQVTYEESGWYDGQTWTKPDTLWERDRLIVTYQLLPILRRLRYTVLTLLGGLVLDLAICSRLGQWFSWL